MPESLQSIAELVGMIVIFIIVLVVCYYTTKFVASRQIIQKKTGNFEVVETHSIAQNRYLQLVRMGSKYVVISVTKDSVRYITELSEEEVCLIKKDEQNQHKNFKDVFSNLLKKQGEDKSTQVNNTDK